MKTLLLFLGSFLCGLSLQAQTDNSFKLSEEVSKEVIQSQEYIALVKIQNDFLDIVSGHLKQGVSLESINTAVSDAIRTDNYQEVYKMLFTDYDAGEAFLIKMADIKKAFLKRNSFIEQHIDVFTCKTCSNTLYEQADFFFKNFSAFDKNRYSPVNEVSRAPLPTCGGFWNQVRLVACAGACGLSTAGIGIALCGWGCWCAFCSQNSSLSSVICAN